MNIHDLISLMFIVCVGFYWFSFVQFQRIIKKKNKFIEEICAHNKVMNIEGLKKLYNSFIDTEEYENAQIVSEWINRTKSDTVTQEFIDKLKNTIIKDA